MKQKTLNSSGITGLNVTHVGGDLQVVGWERAEVSAKSDDDRLSLEPEGETIQAASDGDLILYIPGSLNLVIGSVGGDADLRAVAGSLTIGSIAGDLQMRNVGAVAAQSIGGDLSLRSCAGDLAVTSVGGDASLHNLGGNLAITVGADLYLRDCENNVTAQVGADAALYLRPVAAARVQVTAGSDILLRLPVRVDVELNLQGCDDESIRVDIPGVKPVEVGMFRKLVLGAGGGIINLQAGAEVVVTSRETEWESVAEFEPLGRDGPFAAGEFPGLSSDLHERISQRVEAATRRALEQSMRAKFQSDQVQRHVEKAMRKVEKKMEHAERRAEHMGIHLGPSGPAPVRSVVAAAPPSETEPVTDEERLVILKMLQDKKISIPDAEKLLAALDGK